MSARARIALKIVVWLVGLAPLGAMAYWFWTDDLTANPIEFVTRNLGDWALRLLLASLAMTPLRLVFGLSWPLTLDAGESRSVTVTNLVSTTRDRADEEDAARAPRPRPR